MQDNYIILMIFPSSSPGQLRCSSERVYGTNQYRCTAHIVFSSIPSLFPVEVVLMENERPHVFGGSRAIGRSVSLSLRRRLIIVDIYFVLLAGNSVYAAARERFIYLLYNGNTHVQVTSVIIIEYIDLNCMEIPPIF